MRKFSCAVLSFIGVLAIAWGTVLIHHEFRTSLNILWLLKSGADVVNESLAAEHSYAAWVQVVFQVGLVVGGSVVATAGAFMLRRPRSGA